MQKILIYLFQKKHFNNYILANLFKKWTIL